MAVKLFQVRFKALGIIKPIVVMVLMFCGIGAEAYAAEIFSVPENLKDNVLFWKKIYTEISLKEGVLHDSDYPLIIYKTLVIGERTGRNRTLYIRHHKNMIVSTLKSMVRKRPSQWTAEEQEIADLFRQYASLEELKSSWERLRFQQGQKERYKEGLERSGAYMAFIRLMFKIYRIPGRIAYLPHVESSFNINAYSRVGAAGMWQFMHSTARLYNLKVDYRIDERRDPIQSTIAAAMLLKKNYSELNSWPLALTAYNHGLASIKRAVKTTGSTDLGVIIEKYKNRRFRFASKNFYGCFLAASEIAANPEKYFSDINYHTSLQYHELPLESYIQPKILEENLGISQAELQELNPALRPIVFRRQLPLPPGYKLRIPPSLSLPEAKEKLAAIPTSAKKAPPETQNYYTVGKGDTLYSIARRFRVTVPALLMYNEISSQHRIYIGQVLRIPGKTPTPDTITPTAVPAKPEPTLPPPPRTTPSTSSTPPETKTQTQVISETTAIQDNAALEKPKSKEANTSFDATSYHLEVKPLAGNQYAEVIVSVEENLGLYAEWLNIPVSSIRRLNSGRHSIRYNQKIKIPLRNQLTTLEQFNARRLEYHMAEEEDFYSQYQVVDVKDRTVRYGETLWSICNRDEEIPIWLLMKYNPDIDLGNLKANTRLTIPVLAPKN